MLEGKCVSRISVRGLAVASATAVTTVGAVVGAAAGADQGGSSDDNNVEATAADATLIADIPAGQHSGVQTAALTRQADTMSDAAQADARKAAEESARKKAAADAEAKKEAAQKKAAAEKKAKERAAQQTASRSSVRTNIPVKGSYSTAEVQSMARSMVPSGQFQCFSNIVSRESGWNYKAVNASSGAYGLFQALPGSKMASAGSDWQTNPQTQIKWGLNYMNSRYGSPCEAWSFWQANNWY
jgi:flagellar biosynthesis GTPase FlhF